MLANRTHQTVLRSLLVASALGSLAAPSMAQQFARSYGTSGEGDMAHNVRGTPDDGLVVTGFRYDGASNATAMKLDAAGNVEWRRTYISDQTQLFDSVTLSNGDSILVGQHDERPWVMRIDSVGVPIWQKTTAASLGGFSSVVYGEDGNIYAAGFTYNRFDESMFALAKLDLDGNLEWQFGYGANLMGDFSSSLKWTHDGHLLLAGRASDGDKVLLVKVATDGRRDWAKFFDVPPSSTFTEAPCIDITASGHILLSIGRTYSGDNSDDFWVLRLDTAGSVLWDKTFDYARESARKIVALDDGSMIVAGTTEVDDNKDFMVVRINPVGQPLWHQTFGAEAHEYLQGLCVTESGDIAVVGTTDSFDSDGTGGADHWVLRFDIDGNMPPGFPFADAIALNSQINFTTVTDTQLGSDYPPSPATVSTLTVFTGAEESLQAVTNEQRWSDLGQGLAGTEGVPYLGGAGRLTSGSFVGMVLSSARKNSVANLFIGPDRIDGPLLGGTLVPDPQLMLLGLPTGPEGLLSLSSEWPDFVPPGFTLYVQALVFDINAPQTYSFSNAIRAISP